MNDKELMTLYAGLAMQGLLAANYEVSPQSIARVAFDMAEAMVREQKFRESADE